MDDKMAAVSTSASPWVQTHPETAQRVDDFLRAHRVTAEHRAELLPVILEGAERKVAANPKLNFTTVAVEDAEALIEGWISRLVSVGGNEMPSRRVAHGLAAVHIAGVPQNWPGYFLDRGDPPPELVERLRAAYLEAGPDVELSSMVPRPIELGVVSHVADNTWRTFDKWPFLRGLVVWGLFLSLLGTAFYLVRF
jgi:hypothetical protein